jgi:disulfide bond formation protein DsbB
MIDGMESGAAGPILFLQRVLGLLTRLGGIILVIVGLWTGIQVIGEAWDLYQNPGNIHRFAAAVEAGSNIDKLLLPGNRAQQSEGDASFTPQYAATGDDFRPSYFLAWVIVLFALLLIGRLAFWAIKTGGELVLYQPRHIRVQQRG